MENAIFTNMVMIEDGKGNVLVQDRLKKLETLLFRAAK